MIPRTLPKTPRGHSGSTKASKCNKHQRYFNVFQRAIHGPKHHKKPSRTFKTCPRSCQEAPKEPQGDPHGSSKVSKGPTKISFWQLPGPLFRLGHPPGIPKAYQRVPRCSRWLQNHPKSTTGYSKRILCQHQGNKMQCKPIKFQCFSKSHTCPKTPQKPSRAFKTCPESFQETAEELQGNSHGSVKVSRDPPKILFWQPPAPKQLPESRACFQDPPSAAKEVKRCPRHTPESLQGPQGFTK